MKSNIKAIPTSAMRIFLEKDMKFHLATLLLSTSTTLEEKKLLRCVEFNDDGISYRRDQVVNKIMQAEQLLLEAAEMCPDDNSESLLVMAKHVNACAYQAQETDLTEFYDRSPCQPTQEQWVVMREAMMQQASGVVEEKTATIHHIDELRARREEANKKAKEDAAKYSYANSGGGSAS